MIGRTPPEDAGLTDDPGVKIIQGLIHEFRGSMIVGVLRLTSRLLMLALGPAAFRLILEDYWKATPPQMIDTLNDALRAAVADPALVRQMQAVGVDLPAPASLTPETVSGLIALGLKRDVPALRARGEYLD